MATIVAHALLVIALVFSPSALAETRVYLLRGWFGVFSAGIDKMAEDLRAKGIKAEAIGHVEWKSAADKIASDRAAGATGRLVLVGHSQGGNNVVDMARELEKQAIPVDLLVTIAPWLLEPVPAKRRARDQLLPVAPGGARRSFPIPGSRASYPTSTSQATWASSTSTSTRMPESRRRSSTQSTALP
jgi:alpha-beta hydrolase superfamily lysophospholipase